MMEIDDIEDIPLPLDIALRPRQRSVALRQRQQEPGIGESAVPGTHAIWVRTFGCAHNQSDSEYMLGQLQSYGYRQAGGGFG